MKFKFTLLCLTVLISIISFHKVIADDKIPPEARIRLAIESNNLFNRIGSCESRDNPKAKNKYSTASGRFQFLWGTWNHYGKELWGEEFYEKNIWDYNDNTELAWYVFNKYGTKDWNESKPCWQPHGDT